METTVRTVIDHFLADMAAGSGVNPANFTPDATVDATVPNWRYGAVGAAESAHLFSGWYADPAEVTVTSRLPLADGELIEVDLAWTEHGVPHAAHQIHRITLDGDRISADTVFCGGRWPASLLAEMEAARAR